MSHSQEKYLPQSKSLDLEGNGESDHRIIIKLKGLRPYTVLVGWNFFNGRKYTPNITRSIIVVTPLDAGHARRIALDNIELIDKHFREKRVKCGKRMVRLIRKSEVEIPIILGSHFIYDSPHKIALTDKGEWIDFDIRDYK